MTDQTSCMDTTQEEISDQNRNLELELLRREHRIMKREIQLLRQKNNIMRNWPAIVSEQSASVNSSINANVNTKVNTNLKAIGELLNDLRAPINHSLNGRNKFNYCVTPLNWVRI